MMLQYRGGRVIQLDEGIKRLLIPAGPGHAYRVAQLDDYLSLPRNRFLWQPPATFNFRARVSHPNLAGTWGFGLWNDPFTATMGREGTAWRLPVLPNTAWFFYASPPNYLSLRDDLPAQGFLAATFRSPRIPALLLTPGLLSLPLLLLRPSARLLRRLLRVFVRQGADMINVDVTGWHEYTLKWQRGATSFFVDGDRVLETPVSPHGPLGFVLWIDNQYATFTPEGRLRFGILATLEEAWLEVEEIRVSR